MAISKNTTKEKKDKFEFPVQFGKATLKPYERLKLKSDFDYVRNNGTKFVARYFLLVSAKSEDNMLKYGVICGRKFNLRAVVRNRARRLIRESFRLLKAQIKPAHIIFIPKKQITNAKLQDVQYDMIRILKYSRLWEQTDKTKEKA